MNSVCGIIVTFNPDEAVVGNIERLVPQVQWLVIVDNGSRPEALANIRQASKRSGFQLIEFGRNVGIAAALNCGVEWARSQQARWVALFDQDSTTEPGLVEALLRTYEDGATNQRVGIVSSKHFKRDTRVWMMPLLAPDGEPESTITSGSLMPLSVFDECGPFEEDFIIDSVDAEHCLRLRSQGYTILLCEDAILWVTLGSPKEFKLFGKTLFVATHYSPARRYYNTRNRLVLVKRYWKLYPRWCFYCVRGFFKEVLYVILAERQRIRKLKNIMAGMRDALFDKMGMVVPL